MYYVYILYSEKHDRYYVGQTNNLNERLKRHNAGYESSTKAYMPWNLMWSTNKESRTEALALEKKLKNLSKERILLFIEKYK